MWMTDDQRASLRGAFERLGVRQAAAQFDIIYELTGQRIESVGQLQARHAHIAIVQLGERLRQLTVARTGNAWSDRDEDTWIDKL